MEAIEVAKEIKDAIDLDYAISHRQKKKSMYVHKGNAFSAESGNVQFITDFIKTQIQEALKKQMMETMQRVQIKKLREAMEDRKSVV